MQDKDQEVLTLVNGVKKEITKTNYKEHAVIQREPMVRQREHMVKQGKQKFNNKLRTCENLVKPTKQRTVK